jgi:hypothetical protein
MPIENTSEPTATSSEPGAQSESADEVLYPDDQPQDESLAVKPDTEKAEADKREADTERYDLKMPDGVKLDGGLLDEAMPTFLEAGISRDQAQHLVPLVGKVQQRLYTQMSDEFAVVRTGWATQAKADRELGGEHWKETRRLSAVALEPGGAASPTHEFRELLDESGIGNHPSALRLFRRLGAEIERLRKQAGVSRTGPKSREEALYPNDLPKR